MGKSRKSRAETAAVPAPAPAENWPLIFGIALVSLIPVLWWPQDALVHDDATLMANRYVVGQAFAKIFTTRYWHGIAELPNGEPMFRPFIQTIASLFTQAPTQLRVIVWLYHVLSGICLFWCLRRSMRAGATWPYLALMLYLFHPSSAEVRAQFSGLSETIPLILGSLAFFAGEKRPYLGLALVALIPGFRETGFFWILGYSLSQLRGPKPLSAMWGAGAWLGWAVLDWSAVGGWFSVPTPPPIINPLGVMGFWDGVLTRFYLLGHALAQLVVPYNFSSDYSAGTFPLPASIADFKTLLGITFLVWFASQIKPLLAAGPRGHLILTAIAGALFWNLHFPGFAGNFFSVINTERSWLPFYFALFLWSSTAVEWATERGLLRRRASAIAVTGIALFLLFASVSRQRDWISSTTLYLRDSLVHQGNPKLHFNYGFVSAQLRAWEEARDAFLRALQRAPNFAEAHLRLSLVYAELKDTEKAKEHEEKAAKLGLKKTAPPSNF